MHGTYGLADLFTVLLPDWFIKNNVSWFYDSKISYTELLLAGNWLVDNVIKPINISG